jgi:hypothetical protein
MRDVPAGVAPDGRWAVFFVYASIALDLGLFFLGNTAIRLPLRAGVFVVSLGMLVLLRGPRRNPTVPPHPGARWIEYIVVILAVGLLHPDGDNLTARIASTCLYVAVLAPVLWVSRLGLNRGTFRAVALALWGFYTASATLGVLQIQYPGRFDGAVSANFDDRSLLPHIFTLANGEKVIRPKGLSDNPGGAGMAGMYAIILGTGILLTERSWLLRGAACGGMGVGLFCIYICQWRTTLIIVSLAELTIIILLLRRGESGRVLLLGVVLAAVAVGGTTVALAVGGQSTVDRFATLFADDPGTVYQSNRGQFLNYLIASDAARVPFGAGQGRWGMMNAYFGTADHMLWAEMQWQALLYDGGVPLIVAYLGLFASLFFAAYRVTVHAASRSLSVWGTVVFALTSAAFVATFSFPYLCHDLGIHLLLLNACLYGAYQSTRIPTGPV